MKNITLNHQLTPPDLVQLNQDLTVLLSAQDPDEKSFLALVTHRDVVITAYLNTLTDADKHVFAAAELEINAVLVAYANGMFNASSKELSSLIRGRKAVKKYT
ncbi:MAG: hypothetical protein ACI9C4_000842 [Paraglaciecola sp.]